MAFESGSQASGMTASNSGAVNVVDDADFDASQAARQRGQFVVVSDGAAKGIYFSNGRTLTKVRTHFAA